MTRHEPRDNSIAERLEQLRAGSIALTQARERAQRDVESLFDLEEAAVRRLSAAQVAVTKLKGLPATDRDEKWLSELTQWRKILCDEILSLPQRLSSDQDIGTLQNLKLSIVVIDRGLGILFNTGYDLTTLRLGQLMREAGYEAIGAEPRRHYSGVMPWFGSLPEVTDRIAAIEQQREEAQRRLDAALSPDDELDAAIPR